MHILLLIFLGLLAYSNTFGVPFYFDDNILLRTTQDRDISNILSMFIDSSAPWASRPILHATIALNYHLGGLNTWGYHAVNIGLHLLNGVLLYLLVAITGRHLGHGDKNTRLVAFLSSLFFVLHPVQTETVTNIVHRSMLLATAFYFSGLILFLRAVTSEKRKGIYTTGLFVVSLLGMASRENFATFPVVLLLYDLFFISRFRLREAAKNWKVYTPVLISLCYLAFLVLNNTYGKDMSHQTMGIPPLDYLLTQFNVHWTYLRLLVLPISQNIDPDYPVARTLFEFPTILSFLGYLALWACGLLLARKRSATSFGILWFLVVLLPISFGITLMGLWLGDPIFEHRLYLPSAGPIVLFAATAVRLSATRRSIIPAVAMIALTLGGAAFTRNAAWLDKEVLWGDVIKKSPDKVRGYNNLGLWYIRSGRADEAIETLLTALELEPGNVVVHSNLGIAYIDREMPEKALEHLQILIQIDPNSAKVHSHMGRAYSKMGRNKEALTHFREALRLDPNTYNHNRVAETYLALEDKDSAIEHFEASLKLDPEQFAAHNHLWLLYSEKGETKRTIEHLEALLGLSPGNLPAHIVLGRLYLQKGDYGPAIEHLEAVLSIYPDIEEVRRALAEAYKATGDESKAQEYLIKSEALEKAAGTQTAR